MPPMHRPPHIGFGMVLKIEVKRSVQIKHPIGIVHPIFLRGKVKPRAVFFCINFCR